MIELKKYNFITGDENSVGYAVSKICNFFDLEGQNIILFSRTKLSNVKQTNLRYIWDNKIEFVDIDSFENLITNKSNMFRVDIVVCDFWNLTLNRLLEYKSILSKLDYNFIILAKEYHYINTDDVNDFHIKRESKGLNEFSNNYIITDKISHWTSDLDTLSTSYKRNLKIEQIFDKKDINNS